MPRMPKRIKFRKQHAREQLRGNATRGNFVAFGEYGLQALDPHWVTARQIEAGRIAAQHFLRRQGKVYHPRLPGQAGFSKKPLETRMGKGKADTDLLGRPREARHDAVRDRRCGRGHVAKQAMARIAHKMPVRCRFVGVEWRSEPPESNRTAGLKSDESQRSPQAERRRRSHVEVDASAPQAVRTPHAGGDGEDPGHVAVREDPEGHRECCSARRTSASEEDRSSRRRNNGTKGRES